MDTDQNNAPLVQEQADSGAPQKKKSKLGLILGLSIGGGVLLIGALVTVLLLVLGGGVSKQDYKEAADAASGLRTSYSKISYTSISTSSTDTQVKNTLDSLESGRASFDDGMKKLSDMKAVKNDKEAKELFAKFDDESKKFNEYLDVVVEYYEVIHPVAKGMSSMSLTDKDQAVAAVKNYQTKLEGLDLKQKQNKDYINKITEVIPRFVSALEAYINMTSYDPALYKEVSSTMKELNDADADYKSNMSKMQKDIGLTEAYNELGEYLTDKASGVSKK